MQVCQAHILDGSGNVIKRGNQVPHISIPELKAIRLSLQHWSFLKRHPVQVHSYNATMVAHIKPQVMKCLAALKAASQIFLFDKLVSVFCGPHLKSGQLASVVSQPPRLGPWGIVSSFRCIKSDIPKMGDSGCGYPTSCCKSQGSSTLRFRSSNCLLISVQANLCLPSTQISALLAPQK